MGQKEQCKDELRLIRKRNESHISKGWKSREFCSDCIFYRFILEEDVDQDARVVLPSAFADPKMSVLVECDKCGFTKFDLDAEFNTRRENGQTCVGIVSFKYEVFEGRWTICDDPHPYIKKGVEVNEHPNHVQIICEKDYKIGEEFRERFSWKIRPTDIEP